MIRNKELYLTFSESWKGDDILFQADLWEQEQRILSTMKPSPIGKRFTLFSSKKRTQNREKKLFRDFLPF